jgi:outer membrane protein OmpA-like peptidoglycan-associated protein
VTKFSPIEPARGQGARTGARTGARGVAWFLAVVAVLSGCAASGTSDDTALGRGASGASDGLMGRPSEAYHRIVLRGADSITPPPILAVSPQGCFHCRIGPQEEILRPILVAAAGDEFHAAPQNPGAKVNRHSGPEVAAAPHPATAPKSFPLYFALDTDRITAAGQRAIDAAVTAARKIGATDFAVTGHTRSVVPNAHNVKSLLRRAKMVIAALVARGVTPARISIANQVEVEPTDATAGDLAELAGRRVDIILLD